ncbi:MAG: hypothetical protein HY961_15470 [Ignavibacteriae bacterium]|nr:hypothetical protein [Ignavibacteriota bacterium]
MAKQMIIALLVGISLSCKDLGEEPFHEPPPPPEIIPTTVAYGPGGPAYMRGTLKDYLKPERAATNTHLYLMNQEDYSDTLLHVFVNSTDASFVITELPVDTVDLIAVGTTFLSVKFDAFTLRGEHNSFHNVGPEGLWIDSTLFMVEIADSVPRPNMPPIGVLGYGNVLVVHFKPDVQEPEALNILSTFPFDTVRVYPDSTSGDGYGVLYPRNTNSLIFQRLLYFNCHQRVREAGPGILVVTPLGSEIAVERKEVAMVRRR